MRKPLAVLIVPLICAAGAHAEDLLECDMTNQNFEWLDRAFYVPAFPADRLDGVELQFAVLAPTIYTFRLTARAGTYDGPVIGESTVWFRDSDWIPLESGEATGPDGTPLGGIFLASGRFDFGEAPVAEGTTVTFVLEELATDLPTLYERGPCGQGDATCDLCGFEVIQTEGATPPLDTFWRASVGILVTGPTNPVPASTPVATVLLALLLTMLAARRIRLYRTNTSESRRRDAPVRDRPGGATRAGSRSCKE